MTFEQDEQAVSFGQTVLDNRFLTDYLPYANAEQIKVYLLGLMHARYPAADDSVQQLAAELSLPVSETEAALRYWERRGLVTRLSDDPPRYRFYSVLECELMKKDLPESTADSEYVAFSEGVYALFEDRRKISPSEILLAWDWVKDYSLQPAAVLLVLQNAIEKRGVGFSFSVLEKQVIQRLKAEGITGPEETEAFLRHNQKMTDGAKKVLAHIGRRRAPTQDELDLYTKWAGEWHFTHEDILKACQEMTAAGEPSFKYLDKVLEGIYRHSSGEVQPADVISQEQTEKELCKEAFSFLKWNISPAARLSLYRDMRADFSHAVILLAANECKKNNSNLETFQRLLDSWKERGLTDESDVRAYLDKFHETQDALKKLFELSGQTGTPTAADRKLYESWQSFGMENAVLEFAANIAVKANGRKTAFMNTVLTRWHEAGVRTLNEAQAQEEAFLRGTPNDAGKTSAGKGKSVSAQQYTQRTYSAEEEQQMLLEQLKEAMNQNG